MPFPYSVLSIPHTLRMKRQRKLVLARMSVNREVRYLNRTAFSAELRPVITVWPFTSVWNYFVRDYWLQSCSGEAVTSHFLLTTSLKGRKWTWVFHIRFLKLILFPYFSVFNNRKHLFRCFHCLESIVGTHPIPGNIFMSFFLKNTPWDIITSWTVKLVARWDIRSP